MDLGGPKETQVQSYSPGGASVHNFNRIRQVAPMWHMGVQIGATWQIRLNRLSEAAMRSYVKRTIAEVVSNTVILLWQNLDTATIATGGTKAV